MVVALSCVHQRILNNEEKLQKVVYHGGEQYSQSYRTIHGLMGFKVNIHETFYLGYEKNQRPKLSSFDNKNGKKLLIYETCTTTPPPPHYQYPAQ
jgi:hypothetical protein